MKGKELAEHIEEKCVDNPYVWIREGEEDLNVTHTVTLDGWFSVNELIKIGKLLEQSYKK